MEGKMVRATTEENRELIVYLPPSYGSAAERRYPVVYMQDGAKAATDGLNYLEHLFHAGRLPEMIIVGIVPRDRNDEYTPWPSDTLASGAPGFAGGGSAYLEEVALRIKPYVDRTYRTLPEKEHTALAGCSLGGLISLCAFYRYPAAFGRFALLSASFWYEGILEFVRRAPINRRETRLYMSVGALEGVYKRNAQRDMVERTKLVHSALLQRGYPSDRLKLEIAEDGTHDAMFFARQLPTALEWLFAEEAAGHAE